MVDTRTKYYQKDWNDIKNDLTWKLFDEGSTPQDHPPYVRWVDYKYEFEYTAEYLYSTVWESPCGLLKEGNPSHGYMSYLGINWREENNNPVFRCPYDKADCELNHKLLRIAKGHKYNIVDCAFCLSDRPYDYANSYEKAWDERHAWVQKKKDEYYNKLRFGKGHCECILYDEEKKAWYARYDPYTCAVRCCNPENICTLTGKRLDSGKGNVYYDLKVTWIRREGSLWDGEEIISIVKGKKAFKSARPLSICEAYAKRFKTGIIKREERSLVREMFSNPGMNVEVLNVQVKKRESKDLIQDLRDASEGIQVIHASDLIKHKKEAYRERKAKREKAKQRKYERQNIKKWKQMLKGDNENLKRHALKELEKRGLMPEYEYIQLF